MWVKPRNPALPSVLGGEPPEFDQSRLLGVQSQAELLHAPPEFLEEAFGIAAAITAAAHHATGVRVRELHITLDKLL
jgi:hypothetical protein